MANLLGSEPMLRLVKFVLICLSTLAVSVQAQEDSTRPDTSARPESVFDPQPRRLFEDEFRTMGWADVDLDGDVDLALHHFENRQQFLTLYRNEGETNFTAYEVFQLPEGELQEIVFADIDGDGYPDLLLARSDGPNTIHLNNGSGGFEGRGVMLGLQADETLTIITSDIDEDGDSDLIVSNAGKTKRYLNDGRGRFSSGRAINRQWFHSTDVVAGDIDGDGDEDLMLASRSGEIFLFRNYGDGTFDADGIDVGDVRLASVGQLALADADGDTDLDLFATGSSRLNYFRNQGDGTFDPAVSLEGWSYLMVQDLDLDGDLDIVTSPTHVILNNGRGEWTPTERIVNYDRSRDVMLQDIDNDNDLDLVMIRKQEWGMVVYFNRTNGSEDGD